MFAIILILGGNAWGQDSTRIFFQDVAWSPDGNYIYYSAIRTKKDWSDYRDSLWNVYCVKTDGSDLHRIAEKSVYVSVSPDGKSAATSRFAGKQKEMITVDHKGTVFNVSTNAGQGTAPSWSPDGKKLAFINKIDTVWEVFTSDADGKNAKRLTFSGGNRAFNPSWSPDGKTILYYLEKGDRKDQVYIISSGGGTPTNVTADTLHNIFPGWTPDGRIIYCRTRNDEQSIVIIDIRRKNEIVIPGISSFFARVSPNGKRVAFVEGSGIYLVNLDGSGKQLVTDKISN